jgi:DNA-directed RNA polymerase subunit alpha
MESTLIVQRPRITSEEVSSTRAKFVIEPLEPGFGYTLGNSIRRTLISSIPGAAVTQIRIEGVQHEFSTIPGVTEDVTDIILNLKELILRLHGDDPVTMRINAEGPTEIKASDIEVSSEVEILNPDRLICTLNKRATLQMELTVERGRGYVSAEGNKTPDSPIGLIPIDSIFSPVTRVTHSVESTRVEQRTDYDKLIMDVETNGALSPHDAMSAAGRTLVELLSLFSDLGEGPGLLVGPEPGAAGPGSDQLNIPIEDMDLSVRSYNCLKREGVATVGQLIEHTEQDLLDIRNFGQKSIDEVKLKLIDMGLSLKEKDWL